MISRICLPEDYHFPRHLTLTKYRSFPETPLRLRGPPPHRPATSSLSYHPNVKKTRSGPDSSHYAFHNPQSLVYVIITEFDGAYKPF